MTGSDGHPKSVLYQFTLQLCRATAKCPLLCSAVALHGLDLDAPSRILALCIICVGRDLECAAEIDTGNEWSVPRQVFPHWLR